MLEYRIRIENTKGGCACSWTCSQGRGEADGALRDIKIWSQKWAASPRTERTLSKTILACQAMQEQPEKEPCA